MLDDLQLKKINDVTLSYTFFRAADDGAGEQKVGQARNDQAGEGQPSPLN
jgi:cytochrome c oxidase assembly protein Cox11